MVLTPKYTICLLRKLQRRPPPISPWILAIAGASTGLSLLFERANRRKELLLFTMPHTMYAVYLWATANGFVRYIPYSTIFLFALSMIPIMHAYEREPESLSLLVHSALKFFVGKRQSTIERKRLRRLSEMSTWSKHGLYIPSDVIAVFTKCEKECSALDYVFVLDIREPRHDKTNKMSVRPAKTNQLGHPPSLIRVFAVRSMGS